MPTPIKISMNITMSMNMFVIMNKTLKHQIMCLTTVNLGDYSARDLVHETGILCNFTRCPNKFPVSR